MNNQINYITFFHRITVAVFVGALLVFAYNLMRVKPWEPHDFLSTASQDFVPVSINNTTQDSPRDFSKYESQSDIFFLKSKAQEEAQKAPTQILNDSFKIVALMRTVPATVVIEDRNRSKVVFLDEGKSVDGYTFDRLDDNKVIIQFEGQTFEIPTTNP